MEPALILLLSLLFGWLADRAFGDPEDMPHLIVGIGKLISFGEKKLNQGDNRRTQGLLLVIILVLGLPILTNLLLNHLSFIPKVIVGSFLIFYCLSGHTLIKEVKAVFRALEHSLEAGRKQLSRIVGRDTQNLSTQECQAAALETLSENLSDGVIAPLFWLAILGVPGIVMYKVINTLDSMVGYKNDRYAEFGYFAAKLDDIANFIPARLTALLMLLVNNRLDLIGKVFTEGQKHLSPCSGYPEAALALILDCQFGGAHNYFGKVVEKPTIGNNPRPFTNEDLEIAIRTNRRAEDFFILLLTLLYALPTIF